MSSIRMRLVIVMTFSLTVLALAQESGKSVWDGVYTAAQSERGKEQYKTTGCAGCHGANLEGQGMAAALTGQTFLKTWNNRTLNNLLVRIVTTMPQDDPGSLTPSAGVDIVTFLLASNGFPVGSAELTAQGEILKTIKIIKEKPEN